MRRCDYIMLIDDDAATNFLNKYCLNKLDIAEKITEFDDANVALKELQYLVASGSKFPEFIFVDVNMPTMDGWSFLTEFNCFPKEQKDGTVVVLLTSSLHQKDEEKSKMFPVVAEVMEKPLSNEKFDYIKNTYFKT